MRKIEIQELELIRGKNKVMIISILIFLLSIIPIIGVSAVFAIVTLFAWYPMDTFFILRYFRLLSI